MRGLKKLAALVAGSNSISVHKCDAHAPGEPKLYIYFLFIAPCPIFSTNHIDELLFEIK